MGKGDKRRLPQVPVEVYESNFEAIFGEKKLNVMSDEEREALKREKEELNADGK